MAWKAGAPLSVEKIQVLPPKPNEVHTRTSVVQAAARVLMSTCGAGWVGGGVQVRVKMVATGVCHTDQYVAFCVRAVGEL